MKTFADIKLEVAENVSFVDSGGAILTGKILSEAMIGKYVNRCYAQLLRKLIQKYPKDFERTARAPFYKATGTVSASSTGYTLVATTAILNNGMVGDKVYNSDLTASAKITEFTNTTTVTLDVEIGDDWDGDTIYVLGHEFGIGGDAIDSRYIIEVAVMYNTSDTFHRFATYGDVYPTGAEIYSEIAPRWYKTNVKVAGVPTQAIGIVPEPRLPIDNGIEITYVEFPALLSAAGDVPQLPIDVYDVLVAGATMYSMRKLKRLDEAPPYEKEYYGGMSAVIEDYARSAVIKPKGTRTRNFIDIRLRRK